MDVDRDAAVVIATEVVAAERDVDHYDVSVTDAGEDWEVAFVGKQPRPPGDEVYVYVSKAEGTTRTMHGE